MSITYEYLWGIAESNFDHAKVAEKGCNHFYFSAMLISYFAYEAYLNHVLMHIDPAIWETEKEFFSHGDYVGTEGKLKYICEKAKIDFPDAGREPYQLVKMLKKLRDFSAHGKTEIVQDEIEAESGKELANVQSTFSQLVSEKKASKSMDALREFIISLNAQVRERLHCEKLDENPLSGFLGHASASEVAQ